MQILAWLAGILAVFFVIGIASAMPAREERSGLPKGDQSVSEQEEEEGVCPQCGGAMMIADTDLDGDQYMDSCAACGGTGRLPE